MMHGAIMQIMINARRQRDLPRVWYAGMLSFYICISQ